MTEDQLEAELANWGTWCRWRWAPGQAGSAEGDYRSPQSPHWEVPPVTRPPDMDLLAAQRMELAVCALLLWEHALLRYWYVERWRPEKVCKCVEKVSGYWIHFDRVADSVQQAKRSLVSEMARPSVVRKERALAKILAIKAEFADKPQEEGQNG